MRFDYFNYLKFLLKSTNQHGVHSPFVYNLVTKCFYDKKKYSAYKELETIRVKHTIKTKESRLLFRLERYFNYKQVALFDDRDVGIAKILKMANPEINYIVLFGNTKIQQKTDLIYLGDITTKNFEKKIAQLLLHTHNDSLLLLRDIHLSKTAQAHWDYLKNHPKVTLTIDTYTYGFVFFRKEQAKEHFAIRL